MIVMLGTSMDTKGGISSVVRTYKESGLLEECEISYISTHVDGNKLLKLGVAIRAFSQFLTMLVTRRVDIVHIHSASRGSFYRKAGFILLSRAFGKKIIFHLHGGGFRDVFYDRVSTPVKNYISWIISCTDLVIVLSPQWKKQMEDVVGNKVKVQVVHNSVKVPQDLETARIPEIPTIVFMGLVCEEKGLSDLISAVTIINKKSVKFHLKVAGEGDIRKFKRLAVDKGVGEHTEFLGWIEKKQKDALLRDATVLVLPSYNEGLPMCVLEALSYGLPVIASCVGGIPHAVVSGKNGFLVKPGDYCDLANRLEELFSNERSYVEMSGEAISTIRESFSIDATKKQLIEIYASLRD